MSDHWRCLRYDAAVQHQIRTSIVLALSLAAHWGCREPEDGDTGSEVPAFSGPTNFGTASPAANPGSNPPSPPNGAASDDSETERNQLPLTPVAAATGAASPATPAVPPPAMTEQPPAQMQPVPDASSPEVPVTTLGRASAGCGLSQGIPANPNLPNGLVANVIMTFPPSYDGSTPVPLLFAFHGANRTNQQMREDDSRTMGSQLEGNYVVAFMKSAGAGWDLGADYPRFQTALAQVVSRFCIDTQSLFAVGHSSGAQFIAQMLGDNRARETRFAGVAPVSSSRFGNPAWSPVPTLLIHGLRDTERGNDTNGAIDITQYTESNKCTGGTQQLTVPSCNSFAGGTAVNAGCVQYSGCAATTRFCNHDDPNYFRADGSPSNHGWPCFANTQIFQFFESLR